jgi:hypothetical protein
MYVTHRLAAFAITVATILASSSVPSVAKSAADASPDQLVGKTYRLQRIHLVSVRISSGSVDKVLQSLAAAAGPEYGKYDHVAFIILKARWNRLPSARA